MRKPPSYLSKIGGKFGGGGGRGPLEGVEGGGFGRRGGGSQGGGRLRATHYYHMHASS